MADVEIPHSIQASSGAFRSVVPRDPVIVHPDTRKPQMTTQHLVVARHKENVAWTAQHRGAWTVHVVQKLQHVPNEGREASSYLWWIANHYDDLRDNDRIVFAQGNPYDHCPQFDDYLRSGIFFGPTLVCDQDGWPHHGGLLPSLERGLDIFKIARRSEISFCAGAQFCVTGTNIRDHSLDTYSEAFEWSIIDPQAAWAMERLWAIVFNL